MSEDKIIVKRLVLDLQVQEENPDLEPIKAFVYNKVLVELEKFLLKKKSPHVDFSYDSITLDLGVINFDNKAVFSEASNARVEEALSDNSTHVQLNGPVEQNRRDSKLKILEVFLLTGAFPWYNTYGESFGSLLTSLLKSDPGKLRQLLEKIMLKDEVRERLAKQSSQAELEVTIELLRPGFTEIVNVVLLLIGDKYTENELYKMRRVFFIQAITQSVVSDHADVYKSMWLAIPENIQPILKKIAITQNLPSNKQSISKDARAATNIPENAQLILEKIIGDQNIRDEAELLPERKINEQKEVIINKIDTQNAGLKLDNGTSGPVSEDIWYIEYAGQILLWPYLSAFFREVSVLNGNDFTDVEKAVHLLYYMVTGKENPDENLLLLNKILCGWPLTKPLIKELALAPSEKEEADNMLRAVINNWPALRNTSLDGFRQGFLQRKGSLEWKDNSWLLRVKRMSYDMLLDQLPWGISMVKLGWNEYMIYTEW